MKHFIFNTLFLILSTSLFGADLYFKNFEPNDEADVKLWNSAFDAAKKDLLKAGVTVHETDDSVPKDWLDLSGYGSLTDEELEQNAKEFDEKQKAEEERFAKMGFKVIDGGSKSSNPYREKLKSRKQKKEYEESFKYPFVEVKKFYKEYSYGSRREIYSFEFNYSTAKNKYEHFSFDLPVTENIEKYLRLHIAGISPFVLTKSSVKKECPVWLDSMPLSLHLGKETTVKNAVNASVAALNDNSMVVRDGERAAVFGIAGDFKADLTQKLDSSLKNYASTWYTYSPDGKTVSLVNSALNKSYNFDSSFALDGNVSYTYPLNQYALFGLTKKGEPYFVDAYGTEILFPGKNDEPSKSIKPDFTLRQYPVFAPDGKIWVRSGMGDFSIYIYTADGQLEKVLLIPELDNGDSFRNGDFLEWVGEDYFFIMRQKDKIFELLCYDLNGSFIYSTDLNPNLGVPKLCDYKNGVFYFINRSNSVVSRMVEQKNPKLPEFVKKNLTLKAERDKDPKNPVYLKKFAENYRAYGGENAYYSFITQYLAKCPGDSQAAEQKLLAEISLLKATAKDHSEKALALFDEYGEETAKPEYTEAMKILEKMKKQVPWDTEVQQMMSELKMAFSGEASAASVPALKIQSINLSSLFPAFMNVYANQPAGFVTVKNDSKSNMKNVSVSAYVRKYMDFASKGAVVSEIKPGQEVDLEISTILNNSVLNTTENTTLQMQFTVEWEENGKIQKTVVTRPVTLYKKSAMNWKYTQMLSCFILPNDETVSNFVFENVSSNKSVIISKNFTRAMNLANALGAIPLNYVPDPNMPATENVDNDFAIDTVRYPFDTLTVKGGDCDDMTTLYCSLLESAGVPAAFVTTPGHIFAAFAVNADDENLLENLKLDGYSFYKHEGELWIPVETTILSSGFAAAWKKASEEMSGEVQEFITVAEASTMFPPVSITNPKNNVSVSQNTVLQIGKKSKSELQNVFVASCNVNMLKSKDPVQLNTMAKIFHNFGDDEKAKNALELAVKYDKNYKPAYTNIAILYKGEGNSAKYEEWIAKGNAIKKSSSTMFAKAADDGITRAADVSDDDWNY